MYNFNLLKHITDSLLVKLRSDSLQQLLYVLLSPVKAMHSQFVAMKNKIALALSYNSQYPNLQRLLNDLYDNSLRRIIVTDMQPLNPVISYPEADEIELIMPFVIYNEYYYSNRPFSVILPMSLQDNNNRKYGIKRILNQYKFCGTKYTITYE